VVEVERPLKVPLCVIIQRAPSKWRLWCKLGGRKCPARQTLGMVAVSNILLSVGIRLRQWLVSLLIVAESIALIDFGADSIIESLSGGVLFSRERGSRRFTVANESSAWSCRFTAVGANVLPPA
jgi:hypothetical protein